MVRENWLVVMLKSTTFTRMLIECASEPIVPVTVPLYVPTWLELIVNTEAADPPGENVALAGEKDMVNPAGSELAERETVPPKPPWPVIVIVEEPDAPARIVRLEELLEMAKSPTPTVKVIEWTIEPLVPVIVTV